MDNFNQLTPAEAERLAILAEECGECIQAIGKILRHGYESKHPDGGPTNRESLERECGDVWYAMTILTSSRDLDLVQIIEHSLKKEVSISKYLHHTKTSTVEGLLHSLKNKTDD